GTKGRWEKSEELDLWALTAPHGVTLRTGTERGDDRVPVAATLERELRLLCPGGSGKNSRCVRRLAPVMGFEGERGALTAARGHGKRLASRDEAPEDEFAARDGGGGAGSGGRAHPLAGGRLVECVSRGDARVFGHG